MKIVVLDSFTANPGDLSWEGWSELGELVVYERTFPEQVVERAQDAEVLLVNKVIMDAPTMALLPRLRYIGILATGYNTVDLAAASERGIVVTNVPAYSTMSVVQMVFAHLLNITNRVAPHALAVEQGRWQHAADFCFWDYPLQELDGRTFAIVGVGNTGKAVASVARALGMHVIAYSSKDVALLETMGIEKVDSYDELFARADVLSLHCPLTEDTYHLVNASRLSVMKPTAVVINTGRGPLVDEQALADALNSGRLYGAGVDVLTTEPPRNGSPLIGAHNCFITPHIAWATQAARRRLMDTAQQNVRAFLNGQVQNQVNL